MKKMLVRSLLLEILPGRRFQVGGRAISCGARLAAVLVVPVELTAGPWQGGNE